MRGYGTKVVLIEPTAADLRAMGRNLMSPDRRDEVIATAEQTVTEQLRSAERARPPRGPARGRATQARPARRPAVRVAGDRSGCRAEGRVSSAGTSAARVAPRIHQRRGARGEAGEQPRHARRPAPSSLVSSLAGAAGRAIGAVAEQAQRRVPTADLDERDPDYIRDTLPASVAAREPLLPGRGARPRAHPRGRSGAARGQPLRREHDRGHRRVHARLQHLLRRRAPLLPAGPQPRALDARARLPAQVRHGGRQSRERREGARVRRGAAGVPGRRLRGAPAHLGVRARGLRRSQGLPAARAEARRADRPRGVGRRPGDRALPHPRRGARAAAAARQDVPAQGAADLA